MILLFNSEYTWVDRRLVVTAFLLFLLQAIYLLADLGLIAFPFLNFNTESKSYVIGHISDKRARVKRKTSDSVIWQDSERDEPLHENDSILTLENSTAKLSLKENIQIEVMENTLVVLETEHKASENDPLRIRFERGLMNANLERERLLVGSGNWSIDAAPGSELSVRGLSHDEFEIEVKKGKASIKHRDDEAATGVIQAGERTQINAQAIKDVRRVSDNLTFIDLPKKRMYTHSEKVKVPIRWQGDAQFLRVITPDKTSQLIALKKERLELELKPGLTLINLESETEASKVYGVEVVPAPKIIYLKPLPRDRLEFPDEQKFFFLPVGEAKTYSLIVNQKSWAETAQSPALVKQIPVGSYTWSVSGVDQDGYVIPSFYEIPFYSVRKPLAAPKLKTPIERTPSEEKNKKPVKPSALFKIFKLFMPEANAEELKQQIVFSWYPVEDADHYIIEISSRADFLKPELIKKVKAPEFTWSGFKTKIYYWRVAAGRDDGQLGVFSEPEEFDVRALKDLKPGELSPGVRFEALAINNEQDSLDKKAANTKIIQAPINNPDKALKELAPPATPPQTTPNSEALNPLLELPTRYSLRFQTHKWFINQKALDTTSTYSGFSFPSFTGEFEFTKYSRRWLLSLDYSQLEWEPKEPAQLSLQNEFKTPIYKVSLLNQRIDKTQGVAIWTLPILKRTGLETVAPENTLFYGYEWLRATSISDKLKWDFSLGGLYGDGYYAPYLSNRFHQSIKQFEARTLELGVRFDLLGYFGNDNSGYMLRLGLDIGI
jgi:hypothetical protein